MSNTRRARQLPPPPSRHGRGRKSVVIVLVGIVALMTVVGAVSFASSTTTASTPSPSATATQVTNEQYFSGMNAVWENAWVTGTPAQNKGICELLATNPSEFFKRSGLPTDLLSTITPEEYRARLTAFFDTKCPTLKESAIVEPVAAP